MNVSVEITVWENLTTIKKIFAAIPDGMHVVSNQDEKMWWTKFIFLLRQLYNFPWRLFATTLQFIKTFV